MGEAKNKMCLNYSTDEGQTVRTYGLMANLNELKYLKENCLNTH